VHTKVTSLIGGKKVVVRETKRAVMPWYAVILPQPATHYLVSSWKWQD
jgi:hypothetical protein